MTSEPADLELRRVVHELERHASKGGWDQPARIFALVETADLLSREPDLAEALGVGGDAVGYTPVEQEALDPGRELEEVLVEIVWPEIVPGCAVVVERLVLPPKRRRRCLKIPRRLRRTPLSTLTVKRCGSWSECCEAETVGVLCGCAAMMKTLRSWWVKISCPVWWR